MDKTFPSFSSRTYEEELLPQISILRPTHLVQHRQRIAPPPDDLGFGHVQQLSMELRRSFVVLFLKDHFECVDVLKSDLVPLKVLLKAL